MIPRRLLMGGGGSFTAPVGAFTVLPGPAIGWTEVAGPHATYSAGRTYITGVGGNSNPNDILVYAYVHATGAVEGPVLLKDNLTPADHSPDSHLGGAVTINGAGELVVAYCGHNDNEVLIKISNAAIGAGWVASGFTAPISISTAGVGTATYPQLSYLSSNDRIYLTFRWVAGGVSGYALTYSDDGGVTWDAAINFYEAPGTLSYSCFASNGVDRIDFAFTDYQPAYVGGYGLWHVYIDEVGDAFESDGTPFGGSYPLSTSDMTEIVAAGGDHYPYSLTYAGSNPVIAYQTKNATPIAFGEKRWSGSAWGSTEIGTSELLLGSIESVGGGAHGWDDADRFITGKIVSGTIYVYLYTRTAGTWDSGVPIATATCAPAPVYVHNAGAELGFVWFASDFTDSADFDPELAGVA